MKTSRLREWTAVCAAVLAAGAVFRASADQAAADKPDRPERSCTGTVDSVDLQEHTLETKGFVFNKKFNLGVACAYTVLDKGAGTASDLRPGEKVAVSYQNVDGVLVADRIEQQPMRFEGMVRAVDPDKHTLTLHRPTLDKTFQIADGCSVMLRNEKPGALADIQTGDHVTVTYETPSGRPTARQIAQTSIEFTGTLTAIDLGERTLKARAVFDTKKFNLADNCAIVINGRPDGQLADLKPNDRLVISYDEINGVNVVNRIAPEQNQAKSVATTEPRMGY
jgi:Cu/Ag efflux protein CusF